MGAIVTELAYYVISIAVVTAVGQALLRSGRAFLHGVYGRDGAAQAVSRLLVIAFYLVSLGFVALTAPPRSRVAGLAQALALLTWKVGVLLLVLGALQVTSTLIFARLRRGRLWAAADGGGQPGGPGAAGGPLRPGGPAYGPGVPDRGGLAGPDRGDPAGPAEAAAGAAGTAGAASAAGAALWRPGHVVH